MGAIRHSIYDHMHDLLHTTVFAWWLAERGDRAMPNVDRVRFEDIAEFAPHLGTASMLANGRKFVQGHVPLCCAQLYDRESSSRSGAPHLRQLQAVCGEVYRGRSPIYSETVLEVEAVGQIWVMYLVLPLCSPEGRVDRLLYTMRIAPALQGQAWDALRHAHVAQAVEIKRVVYEKFTIGWDSRAFLFRWLEPDDESLEVFRAPECDAMTTSSLSGSRRTGVKGPRRRQKTFTDAALRHLKSQKRS